jgi:hypothetical protein
MTKRLEIRFRVEPEGAWQTAKGRDAWALRALHAAGVRGVTPIDTPGPRWSGYVFKLRRVGLVIETIHESHGGPFAGTHARYVLHSPVVVSEAAHGEAA